MKTLNEVYSTPSLRRRYEVWFLRFSLNDGSGAWWFRYLLMNPGRGGCAAGPAASPVQIWATWFPANSVPRTFIQGFPIESLDVSAAGRTPFHFSISDYSIDENSCHGRLHVDGHEISWDLQYRSNFRVTLSDKGWIGFSRTPHSDAVFSGRLKFDDRLFEGHPLGFGLQGHNCGYRHRTFWTWAHAFLLRDGKASTLEALVYDMPLGLVFRKVVLWHEGCEYVFRSLRKVAREIENFRWQFHCENKGASLEVDVDGSRSPVHRLPYLKTDCSGAFDVLNNSLARAIVRIERPGRPVETLETATGAVLEMGGQQK